ncbi:rhodanese-like domain-containing protein [Parasphingopyxis sp.]|uniref:rhodanese-like domain-containing protein n=1 Tax=Parasphingopyxis sp. TaxID=1920299 RepID=UPI0026210E0E|nr:rhodanese-like domain-containing protein [Parasphingopyxis sp.]
MRAIIPALALLAIIGGPAAHAADQPVAIEPSSNPQIDFPAFVELAGAVQISRAERLIDLAIFRQMADRPDVLLLDARSAEAFAHGHIEGAVNLPLPDFTAQSLAATIGPDTNRTILIYCNNNFVNDIAPVVRKAVSLALNIQTMINLHGYGYPNVYELGEAVDLADPRLRWVSAQPPDAANAFSNAEL